MWTPSSRTPEGTPNRCQVCGREICIEPSMQGDATCPVCGALVWFSSWLMTDELNFVHRDAPLTDLGAVTKEAAMEAMVANLVTAGGLPDSEAESIRDAVLNRESYGSTGIGRGVAVPHAKHKGVGRLVSSVALSRPGIDFQSLDGRPIHIIFLIVSPPDRPGDHLRALERISRGLRSEEFGVWKSQWLASDEPV